MNLGHRHREKKEAKCRQSGAELVQRGRRLLTLCYESKGAMGSEFCVFWDVLAARHI